MHARGLGVSVVELLERRVAVRKAATAGRGMRPVADVHRSSLAVVRAVAIAGRRIVLVDDVVTTGAQLFGAAMAVWDALPGADVVGFAAVRTLSSEEVDDLLAPVVGTIELVGELRTHREP
jgi:orotate phosphoribosyltransferase